MGEWVSGGGGGILDGVWGECLVGFGWVVGRWVSGCVGFGQAGRQSGKKADREGGMEGESERGREGRGGGNKGRKERGRNIIITMNVSYTHFPHIYNMHAIAFI